MRRARRRAGPATAPASNVPRTRALASAPSYLSDCTRCVDRKLVRPAAPQQRAYGKVGGRHRSQSSPAPSASPARGNPQRGQAWASAAIPPRTPRTGRGRRAGPAHRRARSGAAGASPRNRSMICKPDCGALVDSASAPSEYCPHSCRSACRRGQRTWAAVSCPSHKRFTDDRPRPEPARPGPHRLDPRGGACRSSRLPFNDLLFHAQRVHRANFDAEPQCRSARCSRSRRAPARRTASTARRACATTPGLEREQLLDVSAVVEAAQAAKANGATRFCMGAAYRSPKPKQLEQIKRMVREVRALGLETCATARHAHAGTGARTEGRGPRLLQPQPRHLARVLRRDHHHAHVPGPPGHAAGRARCGHQRLLRRHPRHGRIRRRPRRAAAHARHAARSIRRACRSTSWCRCRARRCTACRSSTRSTSCAQSRRRVC